MKHRVYFNWQVGLAGRGILKSKLGSDLSRNGQNCLVSRQTSVVGKKAMVRTGWRRQGEAVTDFSADGNKCWLKMTNMG